MFQDSSSKLPLSLTKLLPTETFTRSPDEILYTKLALGVTHFRILRQGYETG